MWFSKTVWIRLILIFKKILLNPTFFKVQFSNVIFSLVPKTVCAMQVPSSRKVKKRCLKISPKKPESRANHYAKAVKAGFAWQKEHLRHAKCLCATQVTFVPQRHFARRRCFHRTKTLCETHVTSSSRKLLDFFFFLGQKYFLFNF